jgi:hypothetical protein
LIHDEGVGVGVSVMDGVMDGVIVIVGVGVGVIDILGVIDGVTLSVGVGVGVGAGSHGHRVTSLLHVTPVPTITKSLGSVFSSAQVQNVNVVFPDKTKVI